MTTWQVDHPEAFIIPVNPVSHQLVGEKDTAAFSKTMHVYIIKKDAHRMEYIEPLGDGFYFSPITISREDNKISVYSEREHEWTFYIDLEEQPADVLGADQWEYIESNQIIAKKEGMQFDLIIQ